MLNPITNKPKNAKWAIHSKLNVNPVIIGGNTLANKVPSAAWVTGQKETAETIKSTQKPKKYRVYLFAEGSDCPRDLAERSAVFT